jgi:lysophospholipase L1-like esterase
MTNGELTLFSGLADEAHLVSVDLSEAFGTAAYIPGAGPGLTVAGEAPEALLPAYRYHFARPDVVTGTALTDHPSSDGFEPARVLDRSPGTGSMFPSMGLRGSFSELIFTVRPPASPVSVYVSVDGGDPLRLDPTSGVARYVPEPGEHSYCIWTDATGRTLVVGTNEAADLAYQPPRLFAIGHSITEGVAAGDEDGVLRLASFTDLPMTAARNGYVPGISGIGGNRVDHAAARIDGVLSKMTIAPQDVAIVDLGRNDSSLDGQAATDYHAILDSLKARGFGRILCLSVMYDGTAFDGLNQQMRDIISSRNDSSIIYIDRDHYTPANGVTAPDGVHPDRAGYLAMNELNKAAIDPYLP